MGVEFNGPNGRTAAETARWGKGTGVTPAELRKLGREEASRTIDYSLAPIRGGKVQTVKSASYVDD